MNETTLFDIAYYLAVAHIVVASLHIMLEVEFVMWVVVGFAIATMLVFVYRKHRVIISSFSQQAGENND